MERGRRQIILGVAALVFVQALAITIYAIVKRDRSTPSGQSFMSETLASRAAPEVAFERSDGTPVTLSQLKGKTVLVHFWATWCAPCRHELPGLFATTSAIERSSEFELLAVSVDDDWAQMRSYFDERIPRAVVRPAAPDVHRLYGAKTLPDTYLVDASGRLVLRYAGARDWTTEAAREHLARAIEAHGAKQ